MHKVLARYVKEMAAVKICFPIFFIGLARQSMCKVGNLKIIFQFSPITTNHLSCHATILSSITMSVGKRPVTRKLQCIEKRTLDAQWKVTFLTNSNFKLEIIDYLQSI